MDNRLTGNRGGAPSQTGRIGRETAMNEEAVNILLIEDEEGHAELVRRAFEARLGQFHLTVAGSLTEAKACLVKARPDLIIADLHLPDGLGTALLLADGEEATIPMVVMTAQGDEAAAVDAMKAGAIDYLVKSEEVLVEMPRIVERALREVHDIATQRMAEGTLKRLAAEVSVMAEIGRIVNSSLEIDEVYQRIGTEFSKLIDFDRLSLTMVDRENGIATQAYITGFDIPDMPIGLTVPLSASYSGEAVRTKVSQLILLQHEQISNGLFPTLFTAHRAGLRSLMIIPLTSQGTVVALLNIQSKEVNAYSSEDVRVAESIGAQIAGAITNAQQFAVQKQMELEASVLAELGRIVSSSLDIDEVYKRIDNEVQRLINFDRLSISLIDQKTETSVNTFITGIKIKGLTVGRIYPLSESTTDNIAINAKATQLFQPGCEEDLDDMPAVVGILYRAGIKSTMAVPLFSQGEIVATLRLQSIEANAYSAEEVRVAELIGAQIVGAIANAQFYAQLVDADEAISKSEELFRDLYDKTRVMMHSINRDGTLLSVNDYWLEAFGYERSEVIGRKSTDFFTEDSRRYAVDVGLPEFWKLGVCNDLEYQVVKKSGEVMDILLSAVLKKNKSGDIEYTRTFIVDVTDRKQAEAKVNASLREKEVLLQEINHRVKNNLQIISSLLSLQSKDIKDETALKSFQVSQDRIKSMALVHEKLYQSEDLSRIDFGEYIESLATDLVNSYGLGARQIDLKIDVGEILLGVGTAIPCGVIVNELVSNSLKHAFPGDRSGEIAISFSEADDQYTMVFKDDGVGFPEDLNVLEPSSLGWTIVNALTAQLGGTINFSIGGESVISITFPTDSTEGE